MGNGAASTCCSSVAERPNGLLLDEPTNDLALDTLRVLEDFLETWPGSLVVVSHDRAYLERSVTDVVVLYGDGRSGPVRGGYATWAAMLATSTLVQPAAAGDNATTGEGTTNGEGRRTSTGAAPVTKMRTPSTLRRLLGMAEREMASLEARCDQLVVQLATAGAEYIVLTG